MWERSLLKKTIFSTDLFKKHELDMSTFTSLNEADLIEIGVSAFGARRKMLLLIAGNSSISL